MFHNYRLPSWQNDPFWLRASRFWTRSFYHSLLHRTSDAPGELQSVWIITRTRLVVFYTCEFTDSSVFCHVLWYYVYFSCARLLHSASNSASSSHCGGQASCDLCLLRFVLTIAIKSKVLQLSLGVGKTFFPLNHHRFKSHLHFWSAFEQSAQSQCRAADADTDLWPHQCRAGNRISLW